MYALVNASEGGNQLKFLPCQVSLHSWFAFILIQRHFEVDDEMEIGDIWFVTQAKLKKLEQVTFDLVLLIIYVNE